MVCLPENFAHQSSRQSGYHFHENPRTGEWFKKYAQIASDNQVWISFGSYPETSVSNHSKHYQTHFIINSEGQVHSKYRKMHLFDAEL